MFVISPQIIAEEGFTPSELSLVLYVDGVVDVDCEVDMDPTRARANITLFGATYQNLIVKDQDGLLLDYEICEGFLTVDVLGSQSVEIHYSTSDLTDKAGSLWSLNLLAPMELNVKLPMDATIIKLDPPPTSIRVVEERASLTMPAGDIEISYILGLVGMKDHALAFKEEAESALEALRADGFSVEHAEQLIQQGIEAYDQGQYSQAEQYFDQVKTWITQTRAVIQEATEALAEAASAIDLAEIDKRTSLLDQAREELGEAQLAYESGEFGGAKYIAERATMTAQLSKPVLWYQTFPILPLIGGVVTAPLIILYLFRRRGLEPVVVEPELEDENARIDLDLLFRQRGPLRLDDREVIRFISESGGGVFASELRKRFGLPKSSAWRMIRRLERDEIVETVMVGRETYVKISPRYVLKASEVEPAFQTVPAGSYYQTEEPI